MRLERCEDRILRGCISACKSEFVFLLSIFIDFKAAVTATMVAAGADFEAEVSED